MTSGPPPHRSQSDLAVPIYNYYDRSASLPRRAWLSVLWRKPWSPIRRSWVAPHTRQVASLRPFPLSFAICHLLFAIDDLFARIIIGSCMAGLLTFHRSCGIARETRNYCGRDHPYLRGSGRRIPSFFSRDRSVPGRKPRIAAAPYLPSTRQ
jgi:hypothetical protein